MFLKYSASETEPRTYETRKKNENAISSERDHDDAPARANRCVDGWKIILRFISCQHRVTTSKELVSATPR